MGGRSGADGGASGAGTGGRAGNGAQAVEAAALAQEQAQGRALQDCRRSRWQRGQQRGWQRRSRSGRSRSRWQCDCDDFFVTSTGNAPADLNGLQGADTKCQDLAEAVGAGDKTWRAYLSVEEGPGGTPIHAEIGSERVRGTTPTAC